MKIHGGYVVAAVCLVLALICGSMAWAQEPVLPGFQICNTNDPGNTHCSWQPVDSGHGLPVTASLSGFHQESVLTPFTATTGGVSSGSFTAGKVAVVTNVGATNTAYCQLGASATTSSQPIGPSNSWFAFTSTSETQVTCATSTSTTTINVSVGTGLPTGTGGGSGGGGSGGASATDQSAFTQGTSSFGPGGGVFNDTATLSSGQQGTFRMTTKRAQIVDVDSSGNQLHADIIAPPTLGSASAGMTYKKLAALSNTAVAVDAAAGQLYELYCYNPNASVAYVQVYDTAQGSVTVGTTAAVLSYGIPATSASGFAHSLVGIQFATAITVAATTTAGNGTAPGTALDCDAVYK